MASGNLFAGEFYDGGYFGAVVPGPSVYYQGAKGSSSRKKRRRKDDELFDDLETTIRAVLRGPAHTTPLVVQSAKQSVVVDQRTDFHDALRHLDRIATDHRDLALRVARLRADMERTAQQTRHQLEEDEDETMMVLL